MKWTFNGEVDFVGEDALEDFLDLIEEAFAVELFEDEGNVGKDSDFFLHTFE